MYFTVSITPLPFRELHRCRLESYDYKETEGYESAERGYVLTDRRAGTVVHELVRESLC